MSNIIKKISARAKQIRKKHPGKAWQMCIKQASKEIKAGKIGSHTVKKSGRAPKNKVAKKKAAYRQTGGSSKFHDEARTAKSPGKRVVKTASGSHVYYERRKNRSDKPGSLSGMSAASLKSALRIKLLEKLGKAFVRKTQATTKTAKRKIQKEITSINAELKKLK